MRSYLPIFLLVGAVLAIAFAGFLFFKNTTSGPDGSGKEEEEAPTAKELPLEERPYVTLTPNSAGNELTLMVNRIPASATIVEYELRYTRFESEAGGDVPDGVPGSVKTEGKTSIERKLTLGTCSSGVCRYHKNVKDIALTIRLRDSKGKLIAQKLSTEVVMETGEKTLKSADGKFTVTLDKTPRGVWIVMSTLGLPSTTSPGTVDSGPFGVFSSASDKVSASVSLEKGTPKLWDGSKWGDVSDKTKVPGIFVAVSSQ